jgi:hypothetical protein
MSLPWALLYLQSVSVLPVVPYVIHCMSIYFSKEFLNSIKIQNWGLVTITNDNCVFQTSIH